MLFRSEKQNSDSSWTEVPIGGSISISTNTLSFSSLATTHAGTYRVTVTGRCATSAPVQTTFSLTVYAKPTFDGGTNPVTQKVCPFVDGAGSNEGNGSVTLTASPVVTGTGEGQPNNGLQYAWQIKRVGSTTWEDVRSSDASGIHSFTLTITRLVANDPRLGQYRLMVTGGGCWQASDDIHSDPATVDLHAAPTVDSIDGQKIGRAHV